MELKTGDILHCTGYGFISSIIKWLTKSKLSHTACFISIWGQPYIIDAQSKGVSVKPFKAWTDKYVYEYTVSRKKGLDEKEWALRAMSKVGMTSYDYYNLVIRQVIYRLWFKLTGWHLWIKVKSEEHEMVCSEYVAWTHEISEWEKASPEDIYQYCINNPNIKTIF